MRFQIIVSEEIRQACPDFKGAALYIQIKNSPSSPDLWVEIDKATEKLRTDYTLASLKERSSIKATRTAYKQCGKDPSRYRPSAESLCRRLLRGISLYKVDTVVDLLNLASIESGYSIGGFDADRIQGDTLTLGIGKEGEPYTGIGRGELNIAGMPVYRDNAGGIGTPTSDNERTKLSDDTKHLLVLINGYDGNLDAIQRTVELISDLCTCFAEGKDMETVYY